MEQGSDLMPGGPWKLPPNVILQAKAIVTNEVSHGTRDPCVTLQARSISFPRGSQADAPPSLSRTALPCLLPPVFIVATDSLPPPRNATLRQISSTPPQRLSPSRV